MSSLASNIEDTFVFINIKISEKIFSVSKISKILFQFLIFYKNVAAKVISLKVSKQMIPPVSKISKTQLLLSKTTKTLSFVSLVKLLLFKINLIDFKISELLRLLLRWRKNALFYLKISRKILSLAFKY